MDKRVRTTSATLRADKKMRELVELISDRQPISVCELGIIMELSSPGIRKYIYRLVDAQIVMQFCDDRRQSHIKLVASEAELARFMKDFNTPEPPSKDLPIVEIPSDRRLHIMADDIAFKVRADHAPARRDPLVAALFGPAQNQQLEIA